MNPKKLLSAVVIAACLASGAAYATYDHAGMNPEFTPATSVANLPTGCRLLADDITNLRPIFIDCDDVIGLESAITATDAEVNYNDLTTLGTLQASKVWTTDSALDTIMPTGGKLTVQSGGEIVLPTGSVLTVDTVAVNHAPLAAQARAIITICGDGTTVNNNTVYYGPSQVLTSSATIGAVVCDTTAAGNTTEATADAPALPATAFYPLGMVCWAPDSNATVTFTLRSAEAAITPAISVSIADNILAGSASATATTAVASGATLAVAVASTANLGALPFRCDITVAY